MKELSINLVTLVVPDYDVAIKYFVETLRFSVIQDTPQGLGKRWVVVAPSTRASMRLLLAQASTEEQSRAIGNQTGGRVFLFLYTIDFDATFEDYIAKGVNFIETPRQETYGKVVKFRDAFGNLWDLLEHQSQSC